MLNQVLDGEEQPMQREHSHLRWKQISHNMSLADTFYCLSVMQCRELAYTYGKANHVKLPSSQDKEQRAGKDWFIGFKGRHSLLVRSPEATSLAHAFGFNKPAPDGCFDKLAEVMDRYKFQPSSIYNTDETELTTVQNPKGIVAKTGKKYKLVLSQSEREREGNW